MKLIKTISLLCLLALVVNTTDGFTQSETVQAEGTVLQPLSVTGTNLEFGDEIFPGIEEVVARTDAEAAQFDITGEEGKVITANFILPTELELEGGGNSMPITFSTTDAGYADESGSQGTATEFDPSSELETSLSVGGALFIWLGATVEPADDQAAGVYSADITLDTAYTGD